MCATHWTQGDGCNGGYVLFPCGIPPMSPGAGQDFQSCAAYCMGSQQFNTCEPVALDGGYLADDSRSSYTPTLVHCYVDHTGRRPARLVAEPSGDARTVGEMLARAAYLEAASVTAFTDLATQVAAHGAPRRLARALHRAARDEVRHAERVGTLARARGAQVRPVRLARAGRRSLLALALENAREGCVRETWGAACALTQSIRATDTEVRRVMRTIACDELRHATLSWNLAEWLDSRLTPKERAGVDEARARAIDELARELRDEPSEKWRGPLGLPTRAEAQTILQGMRAQVWVRGVETAA